ncbi:hypothetical protein, partial [Bradyrhizobium sp. 174]|uniref:hypothetical protein n=1 Tax=Bradyrhizobium sp. 174 TaxID=2782645 RepID=UPI001FFA5644
MFADAGLVTVRELFDASLLPQELRDALESALGLGCVETQLKGGRGRQSLQAADVFASDRLC